MFLDTLDRRSLEVKIHRNTLDSQRRTKRFPTTGKGQEKHMRGPFAVLLATTILVGTVFSNEAYAQKKRVVVEMFNKGPNPAKVRAAVIRGLLKNGIEVVPDKRIAALEADLGLIKVSDSYAAVARETKAVAFIGGVVTPGRRAKARV